MMNHTNLTIETLKREYEYCKSALKAYDERIAELNADIARIDQQIAEKEEELREAARKQIRAFYEEFEALVDKYGFEDLPLDGWRDLISEMDWYNTEARAIKAGVTPEIPKEKEDEESEIISFVEDEETSESWYETVITGYTTDVGIWDAEYICDYNTGVEVFNDYVEEYRKKYNVTVNSYDDYRKRAIFSNENGLYCGHITLMVVWHDAE